jgi:hypothetical protein
MWGIDAMHGHCVKLVLARQSPLWIKADLGGMSAPGAKRTFGKPALSVTCHKRPSSMANHVGDLASNRDFRHFLLMGGPTSERWRRMMQRAEAALRPQD